MVPVINSCGGISFYLFVMLPTLAFDNTCCGLVNVHPVRRMRLRSQLHSFVHTAAVFTHHLISAADSEGIPERCYDNTIKR